MSENTSNAMTARRPYMLRAVYEWLLDNQLTPHLVVDAEQPGCQVPWEFVQDGQIVLNISPTAVGQLELGNDYISFNARFSGKPQRVLVPLAAAAALYARENGAGTLFEPEPYYEQAPDALQPAPEPATDAEPEPQKGESKKPKRGRPNLKVIK